MGDRPSAEDVRNVLKSLRAYDLEPDEEAELGSFTTSRAPHWRRLWVFMKAVEYYAAEARLTANALAEDSRARA